MVINSRLCRTFPLPHHTNSIHSGVFRMDKESKHYSRFIPSAELHTQ